MEHGDGFAGIDAGAIDEETPSGGVTIPSQKVVPDLFVTRKNFRPLECRAVAIESYGRSDAASPNV
jgi:hypothetical protein